MIDNELLLNAKKEVEDTFNYLIESVREVTKEYTSTLDGIVAELDKGINLFSNAE